MLFKKLWRTIGQYKAQFISMIIMIVLGIGVFVGFNIEWYSIGKDTERFFDESNFADYRITDERIGSTLQTGFSSSDVDKVLKIDGVDSATRYVYFNVDVKNGEEKDDGLSVAVSENFSVSTFLVREGGEYNKEDTEGVWLSKSYAKANNFSVGDSITIAYSGYEQKLTIRGLILAGDYLVCVRDETQVMPKYTDFGYAYISPVTYATLFDNAVVKKAIEKKLIDSGVTNPDSNAIEEVFKNQYGEKSGTEIYPYIYAKSGLDKEAFEKAVDSESVFNKTMLVLSRSEHSSYLAAESESDEGKTMGLIIPAIFLLIAVLTMVTTMHRLTAKEKTQIGTLKALGFKDKKITIHYTSYALMIGLIGTIIGIIFGYIIAGVLFSANGMMGTYFDMPYWNLYMPPFGWAVIVCVIVFLTLIGFLSVRQMLKGTAADALRPYTPKKVKKLLLEKTKFWQKLSFGTKWNLRDVMRHKARTAMSLIGVLGCVIILVASMGMQDTMNEFLKTYYNDSMLYETKIYMAEGVSTETTKALATKEKGDISGSLTVKLVSSDKEKAISLDIYDIQNDLVKFPAKNGGYLNSDNEEGALICSRIAKEFKLKKGDTLTIKPYGTDKSFTFTVAGVIRSVTENIIISPTVASKANMIEDTDYTLNTVYTKTAKSDIKSNSDIKSMQEKAEIISSFDSFVSIMKQMIVILVVAGVILGIIVLYNLGTMSYTERYREMATLKVVGFKSKRIGGLLIGQNLWITVIGIILGLPLGYGILVWLCTALASEYEMAVAISIWSYLISFVLTMVASLLVGLMVARKNRKINMVEALKGAE